MEKNYKAVKNGCKANGVVIMDNKGNQSNISFSDSVEAEGYIKERLSLGQDPLTLATDYDAMAKHLINH